MSPLDPTLARPRTDLPFLRTRIRALAPPVAAPATVSAPAAAAAAVTISSSLDLSVPAAPKKRGAAPARRRPSPRRAASGAQTLLSAREPTVTLTRLQSGLGKLTVEAACSAAVGDLRLGCAFSLRGGHTSTVQHEGGNRNGSLDGKTLVLQAQRHEFETVVIDLRHCREIERLMFYAFSATRAPLAWAGTLLVTTYGEASLEAPLELSEPSPVAALLTVYQVGGELVLRREMRPFATTVKAACLAYGYDRITWLDDWTPTS